MVGKKEAAELKKSLQYSIKDGSAASMAAGVGDNFISPFAVALKASNFQIGLLSALPSLIPIELLSAKFMEKFSRKKIITFGVLLQALLWLPIALLSALFLKNPALTPVLLIIFYTVYALVGLFISPVWSSWMKDIVDEEKRGKYFGKRNKIAGAAGLAATLIAGFILDFFKNQGYILLGFGVLFILAALFKMVSRSYLKRQYEPKLKIQEGYYFSFWQFLKKSLKNNYGKFVIFIALINFTVALSGPFFTPYMLRDLGLNYVTFILLNLIIPSVVTLVTMPLWGILTDRYGSVKIMQTTAWFIPFIPIAWIISPNIYWLIFIQVISGITWAGFNLAAGNFTYDAVTPQRMSICSAYMLVLSGMGAFLGAILGGLLASLPITFMNIFFFVFVISGIARLIVISVMLKKIKEVRPVKTLKKIWFAWNFVLFSPRTFFGFVEIITRPVHIIYRAEKKINRKILKNFR